jgi:type I restriction enzyme S subunit
MTSTIPLGELVTIRGGGTPSRTVPEYWNGSVRWATVKDFKSTELVETQESITPAGIRDSATNIIPAGSVIIPTRMAVGKAAINTIDMAINQDLKALLPTGEVDTRFLLHFMLSHGDYLESQAQGATVKGIKLDLLRSLPFPRIPRTEQRRIASILDKVDAIRRKREQALTLADDFLSSVFLEMFCDRHWPSIPLGEAVAAGTIVTYGIVQAGPEIDGGVPYIRTGDIKNGEIVVDGLRHTSPEIASKFTRSRVRRGEIVMSIRATVGTTAIVPPELDGANLTQGTARIAPGEKTTLEYLLSHLRSQDAQTWIEGQVKGATFREITLTRLRELPVPIPPYGVQQKFSAIYQKNRTTWKRLKDDAANAADLFAALSQRAFAGDL